jgi:hypothetical protein
MVKEMEGWGEARVSLGRNNIEKPAVLVKIK